MSAKTSFLKALDEHIKRQVDEYLAAKKRKIEVDEKVKDEPEVVDAAEEEPESQTEESESESEKTDDEDDEPNPIRLWPVSVILDEKTLRAKYEKTLRAKYARKFGSELYNKMICIKYKCIRRRY